MQKRKVIKGVENVLGILDGPTALCWPGDSIAPPILVGWEAQNLMRLQRKRAKRRQATGS